MTRSKQPDAYTRGLDPASRVGDARKELGADVLAAALMPGRFLMRSGKASSFYFDKYQLTTKPAILRRLADELAALVPPDVDRLAGAELGGVPLVAAVSLCLGLPAVFVRAGSGEFKAHRAIEGELYQSERVVVIADVLATGTQVIAVAGVLRSAGASVVGVIGVIDRGEGAIRAISEAGLQVRTLFDRTTLGLRADDV